MTCREFFANKARAQMNKQRVESLERYGVGVPQAEVSHSAAQVPSDSRVTAMSCVIPSVLGVSIGKGLWGCWQCGACQGPQGTRAHEG
jgi:hypothetical protein